MIANRNGLNSIQSYKRTALTQAGAIVQSAVRGFKDCGPLLSGLLFGSTSPAVQVAFGRETVRLNSPGDLYILTWPALVPCAPNFQTLEAVGVVMSQKSSKGVSRRMFLTSSGAAAAASAVTASPEAEAAAPGLQVVSGETSITLRVNGKSMKAKVEPRTTLLDVLRYQFDLTGAKPVSVDGSSGASTVLVDSRPVLASTVLALSVVGKEVMTCESLADDAVPRAFVEYDAQQCGFCTPGFVVAVRAFLNRHPSATEEQILAGLNGNICRCGTYANILQAVISLVKGNKNG